MSYLTGDPAVTTLLDDVDISPLFQPYDLGTIKLPNRWVMAPMTRSFSPGGVAGQNVADYYARRAAHTGLLITEATYVAHPSAGTSADIPHIYGEGPLAGWKTVVDAVHAEGSRIVPQLWHLGSIRDAGSPPYPEAPVTSPSGINRDGDAVGEPATMADIDAVIAAFAQSAADAKAVGFDGVEIHGAHGYLLDQFLWPVTNRRADGYGGDMLSRARLSAEVVSAIREVTGPDFPIIFRFSQWKAEHWDAQIAQTPAELEIFLTTLTDAGVDVLHASSRRFWTPAFDGEGRTIAGWAKHLTGLPVITVGSVGIPKPLNGENEVAAASLSLAPLIELFEAGEFDLVAVGRALLSEPAWPDKLRSGSLDSIRPYAKSHESVLH